MDRVADVKDGLKGQFSQTKKKKNLTYLQGIRVDFILKYLAAFRLHLSTREANESASAVFTAVKSLNVLAFVFLLFNISMYFHKKVHQLLCIVSRHDCEQFFYRDSLFVRKWFQKKKTEVYRRVRQKGHLNIWTNKTKPSTQLGPNVLLHELTL